MKSLILFCFLLYCGLVQAADWSDCRRTKLEAISLEQALRKGYLLRQYASRSAMRQRLRDRERWLWRNCRRYSSELRELSARH